MCVFVCDIFPIGWSGEGWQQQEGSYQDDTNTRVRQRGGVEEGEAVEEKSYRLQKIRGWRIKGGEGKWQEASREEGGG